MYKNGGFAEAIPIYEAALQKKASNTIKLKLANCYRILSRPERAAPLYDDIISSKDAKPNDLLHFGETLMMLGKYDSAKIFFRKYTDLQPDDERGRLLLQNIDKVKTIKPLFKNVNILPFAYNSEADDNAPVLTKRGLVFASDRSTRFKLLKEKNPATGRDYVDIYVSDRQNETNFTAPQEFSSKLSELNHNTSNASFTADGKRVFFCRNGNTASKTGVYNMQIYSAQASDEAGTAWQNVELMPFCTPDNNFMYPTVSPNGQRLFFVAVRGEGFGGLDIYTVSKTKKGWSKIENLGSKVNTAGHEGFPFAAADGKLYFCSKGHAGYGGYDIFVTEQDTAGIWQKPKNIGAPINSPYDDISICFDANGQNGAFTSTRSNSGDDIFLFSMGNNNINTREIERKDDILSKNRENTEGGNPTPKGIKKNTYDDKNAPQLASKSVEQPVKKGVTATSEGYSIAVDPPRRIKKIRTLNAEEDGKITYLDRLQGLLDSGKLKINKVFVVENVYYDSTAATGITPDIAEELDKLSDFLLKNKQLVVEIGGHTESLGNFDEKEAKDISKRRAEVVVEYLVSQGIKTKRLFPHGYGRVRPLKDCRDNICKPNEDEQNRRIDVKIKEL